MKYIRTLLKDKIDKRKLSSFMLLSFILTFTSISVPMITRRLINSGIAKGSADSIIWSAIGLGVIGIANQLINLLTQSLEISISQGIVAALREKLAGSISWLSSNQTSNRSAGYMISRIQSDAQNLGSIISSLATLFNQLIMLVASLILAWILLPGTILVLAPTVILAFLTGILAFKVINKKSTLTMESGAIVFGSVGELVEGRETLSAQGGSKKVTENVIRRQSEHIGSIKRLLLTQSRLRAFTGIIRASGLAVLLAWSGFRVVSGIITFGDWYALNLYAGLVLGSAVTVATILQQLGQTKAASERITEVISLAENEISSYRKSVGRKSDIAVVAENITFAYDDNPPVIKEFSISIDSNTLALISGPSGCGKTTLCKILSGQLKPSIGKVFVHGKPPLPLGHASNNGTVAVLPQEIFIFNSTIRENILLGRENATERDVIAAAKMAGIHNEIIEMNQGYNAIPGPKGSNLSLGQRRRIALARSLLANPELIILDEPFASLDRKNVLKLVTTLHGCTNNCTVIVVSHGWEKELKANVCHRFE